MDKRGLLLLIGLVGAVANGAARAQEAGSPRSGLEVARHNCASCHAVESGNARSPEPDAPSFSTIAAVPGMTGAALQASLHTSHRTMPNFILPPDDIRDVVAYILSLK